jgi:hypothetical protein
MQAQSSKTTVYQTSRGNVMSNSGCAVIQVEFGNLFLRFDLKGFEVFKQSIDSIDWRRSEAGNEKKPYHRKIFVALQPSGITMAFHREEIEELKKLLDGASVALTAKKLSAQAAAYPLN